jgi:ABC-2 type transport system ATP-binding protein
MTEPAIRVTGLTKTYGETVAVDNIAFEVEANSITALLGGNGAGKTTTIAMLLGLLLPSSGNIQVLGEDMIRSRYRVLSRMNFGSPYVDLPKRLTVRENLRVFAKLYGMTDPMGRIEQLIEELDLGDFIDRPTGQLSSGQGTRVALAKALINGPELLLLDEPTASLDPDTADWVRGYLEGYRDVTGATILLASHNMSEVERMGSNVLMMKKGHIVDRGSPQELTKRYKRATLEEVFLEIARADEADDGPGGQTGLRDELS